jgi:hypothetical protein
MLPQYFARAMIYILLTLIVTITTTQQDHCTTFSHTLLSHSQENLCEIKGALITRARILTQ